ncbi:MAG: hypothetical protein HY470_01105 [Candidatus Ryanbacteria bacterium]|nr:hypothetical protein [Candidatus Ryanbacteria bacterium]
MTYTRALSFGSLALMIVGATATVLLIGSAAATANATESMSRELSALDSAYGNLYERYMDFVVVELVPQATAEGFVALSNARYVSESTVVGFVSGDISQ